MDSLTATSSSNVFTNVIPDVQITVAGLTQDSAGNSKPVTISSSINTQALTIAAATLVTGFNSLIQSIEAESTYNSDPIKSGSLSNNSVVRDLINQLRDFTTAPIVGYSSTPHYLSEISVSKS